MSKIQLKPSIDSPYYQVLDESGNPIELANRFLNAIELRGLSRHTVRGYGYDIVVVFRWLQSINKFFESLKQSDLFEFIADQKNQKIQPKSINRRLTTCRLFYSFCFDQPVPRTGCVSDPAPYYR